MTGLHHIDLLALQGTEYIVVLHTAGTHSLLTAACQNRWKRAGAPPTWRLLEQVMHFGTPRASLGTARVLMNATF